MSLVTMERIILCATAKEIDFLIYTMRFQDSLGIVKGITKDEVCKELGIHKSKFYSIMYDLEEKGIIRVFWGDKLHGFWTFCVIENSFVCKDDYKKGYINLNTKFLLSDKFKKLKKAEKVICLKILSVYRESRKNIALKLETLSNWTGVNVKYVKKYIKSVSDVFGGGVSVKGNVMTIDLKKCFNAFLRVFMSENETSNRHLIEYIAKSKKIEFKANDKKIKDTLNLFKFMGEKYGSNAIVTAIVKSIEYCGDIVPKYINKMSRIVSSNKDLIELVY